MSFFQTSVSDININATLRDTISTTESFDKAKDQIVNSQLSGCANICLS
jgi:hypothetical protein